MEHKWLRLFDRDGNWTLPERKIQVSGVLHDLDEYAEKHGVVLPDAHKRVNSYEDMEAAQCAGSDSQYGAGDSEVSE